MKSAEGSRYRGKIFGIRSHPSEDWYIEEESLNSELGGYSGSLGKFG